MSERFEKFSERARAVLVRAQEVAQRFNNDYIGTEHLLIGLLAEKEGLAARVLASMNVELERLTVELEKLLGGEPQSSESDLGLTPSAKRAIALAVDEARQFKHQYIGTEHLLAGLLRGEKSVAKRLLEKHNIDLDKVREHTEVLLRGESKHKSKVGVRSNASARTPMLNEMGTDLTALAEEGKLGPVIGRNVELQRLMQILCRRIKNNPVLIGEPGVGKTAIVEKLASMIADGDVPAPMLGKRVVSLEMGTLVAGTKYRGEFEERLKKVMAEVKAAGNLVVFIDEMHTLIGAGAAEGAVDAANILKPALARGTLQMIGATTIKDYRRYVERDRALERRFQPITVDPPSVEVTLEILEGVKKAYEEHHGLSVTTAAVEAATRLAERYIPDRELPDKAIDLIDEAASMVRLRSSATSSPVYKAERELENIRQKKQSAIQNQRYESAATWRDRELKQIEEIEVLKREVAQKKPRRRLRVTAEDIAKVVAQWTRIPVTRIEKEERKSLLKIDQELERVVVGQSEAVRLVAQAVRRGRVGLGNPNRPTASLMFLGPTGVGKTYLVKQLAKLLFDKEDAMVRLDMSEFRERYSVSKLIGAPPSYVGYEEGGQLTEAVRNKSYCIVLLDEIEKAHHDIINVLLQVMDDGRLTDGKGRTVDFKNTILVMTSNLGSEHLFSQSRLGFSGNESREEQEFQDIKKKVLDEINTPASGFRPEFVNRLDAIVVFRPLERAQIVKIVKLIMGEVQTRILGYGITLDIAKEVSPYLADKGFDHKLGARPLRRLIQNEIEDYLSELVLKGKLKPGSRVVIELNAARDGLNITPVHDSQSVRSS